MKKQLLYWMAYGLLIFAACQKEESFELGNSPAEGSLQNDATGDCLPKTVSGTYEVGTPLVPTNSTITIAPRKRTSPSCPYHVLSLYNAKTEK